MTSSILGKEYEPSQFLREETVDGAVYVTYLKRVPLQMRPWTWTENATHTLWEVKKIRCIKAGNLQKLVDALNKDTGDLDEGYTDMFLTMYRTFATVEEVLAMILDRIKYWRNIERRNRPQASVFKNALIMVLLIWLKDHPEDFLQSTDFVNLNKLISFADDYMKDSNIKMKAEELINHFSPFQSELAQHQAAARSKISVFSHETGTNELLDMSPTLVAEQLTYKDAELLMKLIPHHCLGFYWGCKDKQDDLPTVQAVINHYNDVSNIVISSVLMADPKPIHRAKVIEHWIQVSQILRRLNSFSSLNAIIKALQSISLSRLSRSWAVISKKSAAEYKELTYMFSLPDNVFNSRNVLMLEASCDFFTTSKGQRVRKYPKEVTMQGTIPYLDLFLSDLINLDAALPSKTFAGLIDFDKRRQEFEILTQLQLLKKSATLYKFEKAVIFWKWFYSVSVFTEAESHKMSWTLES